MDSCARITGFFFFDFTGCGEFCLVQSEEVTGTLLSTLLLVESVLSMVRRRFDLSPLIDDTYTLQHNTFKKCKQQRQVKIVIAQQLECYMSTLKNLV